MRGACLLPPSPSSPSSSPSPPSPAAPAAAPLEAILRKQIFQMTPAEAGRSLARALRVGLVALGAEGQVTAGCKFLRLNDEIVVVPMASQPLPGAGA